MKKKLLVWLTSDFTHFCISYYLQKFNDYELYAIIDITNKPKDFFKKQDLVKFKKIWFFHDHIPNILKNPDLEYLSNFEKKYDMDLWNLAINERIFYKFFNFHKFTREEILKIDESSCKLFEQIIDEINPDYFITKLTGFHHLEILYRMCKKLNIKTLMLNVPKIGFKCIISDESGKLDFISKLENNLKNNDTTFSELQNYIKSFSMQEQTKILIKNQSFNLNFISSALQFILQSNKNVKTNYNYFGRTKAKVFIFYISYYLKKYFREKFLLKNSETNVSKMKPFVYFPLTVDMDRNLLIAASYYTNQIELIRHIAKSLPVGYILCVKEHPGNAMRGWRQISEFKAILEIPNVQLIHPSISSEYMYEHCSLVLTTGGSSGLESAIYGKPSIVFSDVGYLLLPSVTRVTSVEELPSIIRNSLSTTVSPSDVMNYLKLIEENSFDFDMPGFTDIFNQIFYENNNNFDVEINEKQLENFIQEHKEILEKLALEHVNKIKRFDSLK